MEEYKQRAEWLKGSFIFKGRKMHQILGEMLNFANGDSRESTVVHFCLLSKADGTPCCESEDAARYKMLSHCVQFFCHGFPCPLLYRWKHYGPASSFVKVGIGLFRLLPRALQKVHATNAGNDGDVGAFADVLMAESGLKSMDSAQLVRALHEALDAETNHAEQNRVRRQLVVEEICKPAFSEASLLIDAVISPIEHGMNFLLSHTSLLHSLRYAGSAHPEYETLMQKSLEKFLRVYQGDFGKELMHAYVLVLTDDLEQAIVLGGFPARPKQLNQLFELVTLCLSDIYRRFVFEFSTPPYSLFGLVGLSSEDFTEKWSELEARHARCPHCLDGAFSGMLVEHFLTKQGEIAGLPLVGKEVMQAEIESVLMEVGSISPTTSDIVEIKNGITQWIASRRGGQFVKAPRTAAENTLLKSALLQHTWALECASTETMPRKTTTSRLLARVGVQVKGKDQL